MARSDNLDATLHEIMDLNEYGNYYTDLEMAAAIGKNLLERNTELEHLLDSTQEYADEQVQKSEFLSRQLAEAHKMNENRVKLIEQIENNSDELSRDHTKLQRETKSIQEQNQFLAESLQCLTEKCDSYKAELEHLRVANARLQRQLSEPKNNVEQKSPNDTEKDLIKNEVRKLSIVIKDLKIEQDQEKTTRQELENELLQLINQNEELEIKLREFAESRRNFYIEVDEKPGETETHEVEEDDFSEPFVLVESNNPDVIEKVAQVSESVMTKCQISFLDELDQQYHDLVSKYNSLLNKCKSEGIPYESRQLCMVQRGVQTTRVQLESPISPSEMEDDVPEYKKMFAKIYKKLETIK